MQKKKEGNIDFNHHYQNISNEMKSTIREEVLNDETSLIHKALIIFVSGEGEQQDVKAINNCRHETITLFSLIENGLIQEDALKTIMEIAQDSINNGIEDMMDGIDESEEEV